MPNSLYKTLMQMISSTLMSYKSFQQKLLVNTESIIHLVFQSCFSLVKI